jgi:hypothetical protein
MRDIGRRIAGDDALQELFAKPISLARRVRDQNRRQRGPKVYTLHALEVECGDAINAVLAAIGYNFRLLLNRQRLLLRAIPGSLLGLVQDFKSHEHRKVHERLLVAVARFHSRRSYGCGFCLRSRLPFGV